MPSDGVFTNGPALAEVDRAPEGPEVSAFFDFDGTLIAGYSASAFYQDRARRMEFGASEIARSRAHSSSLIGVSLMMYFPSKCVTFCTSRQCSGSRFFNQKIHAVTSGGTW